MNNHIPTIEADRPIDQRDEVRGTPISAQWVPSVSTPVENGVPDAEPPEFLLGTVGDARLRVVRPIRVSMYEEAGQFVASAIEFDEFGFGETRSAALRDLQQSLVELFLSLEADEARLAPDLAKTLAGLRGSIRQVA